MATLSDSRCLTDTELRALYVQSLNESEMRHAQAHLAECSSCWQRYAAVDSDATTADTQTATPSVMQSSSHFFGRPPRLDGYEIIQELGRGGQAVVYQALQVSTRRKVAIKVTPQRVLGQASERSRFQREIEVLAQLSHPGIVTIHVSGEADGLCYFVMDYVEGVPLDAYAKRSDYSVNDRLQMFIKVCDAVNAAHLLGIVHRDIKPGNILVDQHDEPHLLDFGLAKLTAGARDPADMTLTGDFLGTPKWTSPEQAERKPDKVDVRTDVYSLGMVLYQLLTADLPYDLGGSLSEFEHNIIHAEPLRPSRKNRRLDDELDRIVLKCLRKDRDERYQTAGELARDLRRYLAGEPVEAKSPSLVYMVRTRTRRAIVRAPYVACGVIILLSTIVGHAVGYLVESAGLGGAIERAMTAALRAPSSGVVLEHVRVVGLDFRADVDAIAESQGLTDVSRRDWRSLRRLHGRLLEKLVESECRAVAVDIAFPGETPYDEDFVRGVRALKVAGVDVVVGTQAWWRSDGKSDLSSTLVPEVSSGCFAAGLGPDAPWRLQLLARRGLTDPRPSLALAALAAFLQPGARYDIEFDLQEESAELVYWKPDPAAPNGKKWLNVTDQVQVTAARTAPTGGGAVSPAFTQYGLGAGDSVGVFLINVPPNEVLDASVVEYEKALSADAEQLKQWFRGKAIVVAVMNHPADLHMLPDGRKLSGCFAHACGLSDLLRQASVRKPRLAEEWTIPLSGATLGAILALAVPAIWARRAAGVAAIAAILLITLFAYREYSYLCNPILPVGGFLAAFVGCCTIRQIRAVHQS